MRTGTRTNLNPPPGQSALSVFKRPTFTITEKGQVAWKKSLVVVDIFAVWRNQRRVETLQEKTCATTYKYCKLTSQFIARNYLSFLTAVSREDRRMGFPPLFDNCPLKRPNKERGKSRLFFTLKKKAQN